jgi:hydrogenase maturation protease
MRKMNSVVDHSVSVIGLGNVFLGDDGFGPLAVETFRCQYESGPEVEALDLGTPGLDLAPYLYGRELVVIVDAVHSDFPTRAVSVFCEDDFASSRACLRITGHDPGLWDTLTHLRLADCGPTELIVVGAAPESCVFGDGPSVAMLNLAAEAADFIAQVLTHRGVRCNHRNAAPRRNLWWLPLGPIESLGVPEANINA